MSLLSIVGTTATGKTDLALAIAEAILMETNLDGEPKFSGVSLISADSRQVYRELEILSGADVPAEFIKQSATDYDSYPSFSSPDGRIELHGASIISVTDEWSAGLFQSWVLPIITNALENKKIPIVIGGTGLYHRMLTEEDPQMTVPPDQELRNWAEERTVEELQERLSEVSSSRLEAMNNSDRNNPRRLVRAIEIALAQSEHSEIHQSSQLLSAVTKANHLWYGVSAPRAVLEQRIKKRVDHRLENGALEEVNAITEKFDIQQDGQAFTTIGLRECAAYISGEISLQQLRQDWVTKELQYTKRQKTWWKQHDQVNWFDTSVDGWLSQATKHVLGDISH